MLQCPFISYLRDPGYVSKTELTSKSVCVKEITNLFLTYTKKDYVYCQSPERPW